MIPEERFPEDKDDYHQMKSCADNQFKARSNLEVLKNANIIEGTGTKTYSIKVCTRNKGCSIRVEQRLLPVSQLRFYNLIDHLHLQLDGKLIKDNNDQLCKKKYRERARVYFQDLYEVGRAEFIIDLADLHGRAKLVLGKLDTDSAEYIIREVVERIFASIGVQDFELRRRFCVL